MFESDQEDDGGASSILSSKDSGAGTLGSNNSEGSTVGDDDAGGGPAGNNDGGDSCDGSSKGEGRAAAAVGSNDGGGSTLCSNDSGVMGFNDDGRYENSYRSVFHLQSHADDMEEEDLQQYREVWLFRHLYYANGAAWCNVYFFTERSTLPRVARENDFLRNLRTTATRFNPRPRPPRFVR